MATTSVNEGVNPHPMHPLAAKDHARQQNGALALGTSRAEVFQLVCRHMRKLVGSGDRDYEDLVQTAAERALRDLGGFRGHSSLSTWVYRVCYTTLLTHRRGYKRWLRRFSYTHDGELPEANMGQSARAERSLDEQARSHRLHQAIERLGEKRRTVVVLHDLEGLGVLEIADIVDANVLTVRSRLRDGRRDLAKHLRKHPFFRDDACLAGGAHE